MNNLSNVKEDPFFEKFLSRIPPQIAETYTAAQLAGIKMAFGPRSWGIHAVDIRFSLPLIWRRYYVVLLAGRERRSAARRRLEREERQLATLGNVLVSIVFFLLLLIPLGFVLYAISGMLGLDLNTGAGTQSFLQDLDDQIRRLFK